MENPHKQPEEITQKSKERGGRQTWLPPQKEYVNLLFIPCGASVWQGSVGTAGSALLDVGFKQQPHSFY